MWPEDQRELSDQVFIQAVFLIIHDLKQTFLQFGFLRRDLREEITRPIKLSNVTSERARESNHLPKLICCQMRCERDK